jgi:glycosyltransferase involved in cell wall biosynthesis
MSANADNDRVSPRVSVIVCVHNRPVQIVRCLDSILASEASDFEVVVVDDGSTDDTPDVVADYAKQHADHAIRLIRNERNMGVSGARNAGLREARGAYVLFTDSDCTVAPDWIAYLVEAMDDSGAAAASGVVIDAPPRNMAEWAACGTTRIGRASWQRRRLVGNNMGFRGRVVREYLFDESLVYGCDEDEIAWRLVRDGHKTCFAPEAVVYHDHPMTIRSYLRQGRRQGVGSARYWYKRGAYIGRDLWFLTAGLAALLVCIWKPLLWPVPTALFVLQVLAIAFNEVFLKGKTVWRAVLILPLATAYTAVKAWSVYATLVKILVGADRGIRASKRAWITRRLPEKTP